MAKKPKSAEINPGPGYRLRKSIQRLPQDLITRYCEFPTPDISDMLNRMYTMDSGIRSFGSSAKLVGSACTVKTFPGDNLMVHKSLDIVQPGDVIVIDTGGSQRGAVLGDLISNKAVHRGVAGFIVDGLIRDVDGIRETGLPVFARGVTPFGPLHRGPGELNFPVSCGGIVVNPGDIVVADENGVVVVRQEFAADTVVQLSAHHQAMEAYVADVKKGEFSNEWVDAQLVRDKCEFHD
jgi:RraA family protein